MAVTRRYFDRTPGMEGDVGETTRIVNNYYESTIGSELSGQLAALGETIDARIETVSTRAQVVQIDSSDIATIDVDNGTHVHIPATAGPFTLRFLNVPASGVEILLSVVVSNNDDAMTVPNVAWKGTAPVTADWDAGEVNIFRLVRMPQVDVWVTEWIYNGTAQATAPTVTPPTLTAFYSTSGARTGAVSLSGATLPAGEVAVFFGPTGNSDIESWRFFCNHTGALPAVGAEGDSFVRATTAEPYDLLGLLGTEAVLWDTNIDPTGNARTGYDPDGSNTITAEATLIDGATVESTFTFTTSNTTPGTTPTVTHSATAVQPATDSTTVTVPDGVDRLVVVQAHFKATSTSQDITGMTLGGNALTNIAGATYRDTSLGGVWTGYIGEASLSTASLTLTPSWSSPAPGAYSYIIYNVWVLTNVATPALGGDAEFDGPAATVASSAAPSIVSVPANSILLTSGSQQTTTLAEMTVDIGTATTTVTLSDKLESRASYVADSGASATETANWTGVGKTHTALAYVDFTASGGGSSEPTPIIPGTPSVALTTPAANQIVATWSATTDAVSYELRHGASNPPATAVVAATSPYTITGLASGVLRYVQVRAVSSTGDRSAWSTVQSATPTGSVTPPPSFPGKFLTSDNAFDVAYSEGSGAMKFSDVWIPTVISRKNPGSTDAAIAGMADDAKLDDAINRWQTRAGGNKTAFIDEMGPRLIWTNKLAPSQYNHNGAYTPAQEALQVLDMGKTGSTGTINRDWVYQQLAAKLNRVYRGFNVWEIVMLSIAHETNGPWSDSGYMGVNTRLIGQPSLTGATNAQYGAAMGAALRKAGTTGECADVHRLACDHIIEILWDVNPNIIVGLTPADGTDSAPEGTTPSALGKSWVADAFPTAQLDFICPTIYVRGADQMTHSGGSVDNYDNWTRTAGWMEHAQEYVNDTYGCAFGVLESGVSYAVPGVTGGLTPGVGKAMSDAAARAFHEILMARILPNDYNNGLAFVNIWLYMRNSSVGKPPGDGKGSYHVLEGQWGEYPTGTVTGTTKPTFSTATGTNYPKTVQWFKDRF